MSLINDALKRAKRAQKSPPRPPPVFKEMEPTPSSDTPVLLVIGVLFVLGLGALVYMMMALRHGRAPLTSTAAAPAKPVPVAATTAAPVPATVAKTQSPPPPPAGASPAASDSGNTPVQMPLPKLQGIFYNPTHPSAIIDGLTVNVGNRVSGYQVLAIRQDNVTVTALGQTNVLNLSTQ